MEVNSDKLKIKFENVQTKAKTENMNSKSEKTSKTTSTKKNNSLANQKSGLIDKDIIKSEKAIKDLIIDYSNL
jgi:hypothetical protein